MSAIVLADGELAQKPEIELSAEDAKLLREYKKFMLRTRVRREAIHCDDCFEENRNDGTRFLVTDTMILIECRCKKRYFTGATL